MKESRIRGERALRGMTQEQLAEKLGTGPACVRSWEAGRRNPSTRYVVMMADLFGCTTDYLLGRTEERL